MRSKLIIYISLIGVLMMMTWSTALQQEQQQPYFLDMDTQLSQWREAGISIYPPAEQVFAAFEQTPLSQVRVVILGQDPYHGIGQANGLSFSVNRGIKIPPSLMNIYKELINDIDGFVMPEHGDLSHWAKQGILLLNTVLTVQQGQAHSHAQLGWEHYTDRVIQCLNQHKQGLVFILWGAHAQKKGQQIDRAQHCVLMAPHPSPLSAYRGFFGCRHFSQTNRYLTQQGKAAINWQV